MQLVEDMEPFCLQSLPTIPPSPPLKASGKSPALGNVKHQQGENWLMSSAAFNKGTQIQRESERERVGGREREVEKE